jgi:hypothetical protein
MGNNRKRFREQKDVKLVRIPSGTPGKGFPPKLRL